MIAYFSSKNVFLSIVFVLFSQFSTCDASSKIVVVGGGLSGLTTAYRLHQEGFLVEVYEARNRVGGRIFTVKVNGHEAELGGQNLADGKESVHILKLIDELGLETEERNSTFNLSYYNGNKLVDITKALKEYNFTPDTLSEKLKESVLKAKNMKEVLLFFFDKDSDIFRASSAQLEAYEGAPIEKLSTYYSETFYFMLVGGLSYAHQAKEGNMKQLTIKGGNYQIAQKLKDKLPTNTVHLQHVLQSIDRNSSGSYILTFQNGKQVVADILILAFPCPVYKNIAISPDVIPKERKIQIENLQYATTAKILLPILSKRSQESFTNGRLMAFLNRDHHILNMYYLREYGNFNERTIADTFWKDLPIVKLFYKTPQIEKVVVASDKPWGEYDSPVGHSWTNDPYAGGSYSCVGAGQEEIFTSLTTSGQETVKTLFAPIDNKLFFTGEHTSIMLDVGGTMEAAVEAGERTARMVKSIKK